MKKTLINLLLGFVFLVLVSCDAPLRDRVYNHLVLPEPEITIVPLNENEAPSPIGTQDFYSPQVVSISCDEEVEIHYSVVKNGLLIEEGLYKNPLLLGGPDNDYSISATARFVQRVDSPRVTARYTVFYSQLAAPLFFSFDSNGLRREMSESVYSEDFDLVLYSPSSDVEIYYTTDGTDPRGNPEALLYDDPIPLRGHGTSFLIKAYCYLDGFSNSDLGQAFYRLDYPSLPPPVASHQSGLYPYDIDISFDPPSGVPEGYEVLYSTDLDTPPDTIFTHSLYLSGQNSSHFIQVQGRADGYQDSQIIPYSFMINQNKTAKAVVEQRGESLFFTMEDQSEDSDILIFVGYSLDGSVPPVPLIEGHTDPLAQGEDSEEYSIGSMGFIKFRNGASWDCSSLNGTLRINVQALRLDLDTAELHEGASDLVSFGPYQF